MPVIIEEGEQQQNKYKTSHVDELTTFKKRAVF